MTAISQVPGRPDPQLLQSLQVLQKFGARFPGNPVVTSSLVDRVRASAARAPLRNPLIRAPWVAVPAWAGTTTYNQKSGYAVSNGSNRYILGTQGISAGSGGPTGTGAGPITDGSCTWYYDGPDIAVQTDVPAPTVAIATKPGGLTKNVPYNSPGAFFFTGGSPSFTSFGYRFPSANRAPSNGNTISTYDLVTAPITFESDAPLLWLNGGGTVYSGTSGTPYALEIDGRFSKWGFWQNNADFASGGISVNWNGVRKMRSYRLWVANNISFFGVDVDPASVVVAKTNPHRFRITVEGDSLTAGAGGFPAQARNWVDQFAWHIGCDDYYVTAVGGTGYINDQGAAATTYLRRLPDVLGFNPDVHIVAGLYNDASYTSAQRQAAVLAYYQAFRAGSQSRLMLFGTTSQANGGADFATQVDSDIAAVVTSTGDPNLVYMPVAGDLVPWITGSGNVGAPSGSGNADVYVQPATQPPHFTQAGVDYISRRYAQAWESYWSAQV